jgi:phosphoglycolate phosphatase
MLELAIGVFWVQFEEFSICDIVKRAIWFVNIRNARKGEKMKTQLVKTRVIIFDFDGVLRSASWEGLLAAYTKIILSKGKDPSRFFTDMETFKNWFDMDWHKNIERIDGGAYVEDTVTNALFHTHYDPYVKLFPWVEQLLAHLSERYYLAILSSSSVHSVRAELGNVARFFNLIVGAETVTELKPHPEGVYYVLNHFEISPENAIIIGDTIHDINAGFSGGIWTGAVPWGLGEWDELLLLGAEFYFEHPSKLFEL